MVSKYFTGDAPFVAGSLTGLRSFLINPVSPVSPVSRLTGVYVQDAWQPGWNTARCAALQRRTEMINRHSIPPVESKLLLAMYPEIAAHRIAAKECECGFYAYHAGNV